MYFSETKRIVNMDIYSANILKVSCVVLYYIYNKEREERARTGMNNMRCKSLCLNSLMMGPNLLGVDLLFVAKRLNVSTL